jgi:hypothetical protein
VNRIQRVRRFRLASLALSLGAVLAVTSLPAAAPILAAGPPTVRIDPAAVPAAGAGATFTVSVVSNSSVDTSGVQASVAFDKSLLQITSVARPAGDWGTAPVFIGPTGDLTVAANMTAAINAANGTGSLSTVAAQFTPPIGSATQVTLPANADHTFLVIGFQVVKCPAVAGGTTTIGLPTGPADTVVLDSAGAISTTIGTGSVVTPCTSATGNTTTHVTSSLDAGFLALEVNPTFQIPLLRQVTNSVDVPVKVYSDGTWTLNVADTMPAGKLGADQGHMTDAVPATKRLASPMQAQYDGQPIVTLDQPAANTNVASGNGTLTPTVTLKQFVGPADPPANYGITLVFTATSGF